MNRFASKNKQAIILLGILLGFVVVGGLSACNSKRPGRSDRVDSVKTPRSLEASAANTDNIDAADAEERIPVAADFEDQVAEEISPENADDVLAAIEAEVDAL